MSSPKGGSTLLLISVFVVATCGLIYELVAGTLASYLLGDSVTQFSTIIGVYLFSMGIGAFLSKYIQGNLLGWFVQTEILVGLIGGCSAALLFVLFNHIIHFRLVLYLTVMLTGMCVGMEIPLLMRILQDKFEFKELVSKVFSFDYVGALLASVLFPLLLVPHLGLIQTALLFGMLNLAVALVVCYIFAEGNPWVSRLRWVAWACLILLFVGFLSAEKINNWVEDGAYNERVLYTKTSPYQRITLTRNRKELRLYLNGNLQFSSKDEYRYHEALVHPGMSFAPQARKVLVLGGGDGLAVRELLKHGNIESITLVDLDPEMTKLFKEHTLLNSLNDSAFFSPKVSIVNTDAFTWLRDCRDQYDYVVIDFPDPSNYSLGKLYSTVFYQQLRKAMRPEAQVVVQATSPLVAPNAYWCVAQTMQASGFHTLPYHCLVPSFGEWGFILANQNGQWPTPAPFVQGLRFLTTEGFQSMTYFPPDMAFRETAVNRLNNQALVTYFEKEWGE